MTDKSIDLEMKAGPIVEEEQEEYEGGNYNLEIPKRAKVKPGEDFVIIGETLSFFTRVARMAAVDKGAPYRLYYKAVTLA